MLDLNKTRHATLPHAMPAACRLFLAARPSGSLQYKNDLFFVKAGCGQATERLFVVAYVLDLDSGFGVVAISHVSDIPLPVLEFEYYLRSDLKVFPAMTICQQDLVRASDGSHPFSLLVYLSFSFVSFFLSFLFLSFLFPFSLKTENTHHIVGFPGYAYSWAKP